MDRFASCLAALLLLAPVSLAKDLTLDEAREVVRLKDVTEYPAAARLLRPLGTDEARTLLARLESDLQVRLAFLAREAGDLERARALLEAARRPQLETAGIDARLARLKELPAAPAAVSTLPAGAPVFASPETVTTVCGRKVLRAETRALKDPVYGEQLHVWFKDPAALRRSQLLPGDAAPRGPTLLDLLTGGCGPVTADCDRPA